MRSGMVLEPQQHPYKCGGQDSRRCVDCNEYFEWRIQQIQPGVLALQRAIDPQIDVVDASAAGRIDARLGAATPTREQFARHAQRFGPALVAETAATLVTAGQVAEVELAIGGGKLKRRRRNSPMLEEQVLALHRQGLVRAAIADRLNISDRRVAEILKKSRPPDSEAA